MSGIRRILLSPLKRCAGAVLVAWAATSASGLASAQTSSPAVPPVLPPAQTVMHVLAQLPQVRAANLGIPLSQARNERLQAGPHDWVAKAASNRRSEREGSNFYEAEVALETSLRWPAKVRADQLLGSSEIRLGELTLADTWHEAARNLLSTWFDALRDVRGAAVLQEQAALVAQQMTVTERRVKAGEAASLELLAAQAEASRVAALAARAQGQVKVRLQALQRMYPGLPVPTDMSTTDRSAWSNAQSSSEVVAQQWATNILTDNHELELAMAKAAQARLQAQRITLERRGDPTLGVRASRERSGQESVLGVYVSIPLGGAGRRADARAALAQADMAEQALAEQRVRIETEAWRTASEVEQARHTRNQLQSAQAQIERSAMLQSRAYALGESPLADLLLARRNALEARLAADTAVIDEMQAHAKLLLDTHRLWAATGSMH